MTAGTPFVAKVNFQPKGSPPSGYVADYGKPYTAQGDFSYGWSADNRSGMIERKTSAAFRYDTFAQLDAARPADTWEIAVPNGLYRVIVLAGDPLKTSGRLAIDAEGVTVLDRAPSKASPWRRGERLVFVSDGKLTVTPGDAAIANKINSIDVIQSDPHVTGLDVVNPASRNGMVNNEMGLKNALPVLDKLGTRSVRLWYDVKSWSAKPDDEFIDYFRAHKRAGYHVTVIFDTPTVPKASEAKAFFQRMLAYKDVKQLVDIWQIGNEMNLTAFWTGTYDEYTQRVLKPSYEVLNPAGEPTITGGITYDVQACEALAATGAMNYCDYAGFHPYGESAAVAVQRATDAKAAFGGKPLIVTEWNIQNYQWDLDLWAEQVKIAAEGLAQVAYLNYYYALRVDDTSIGAAGAVYNSGKPNRRFYDVIASWALDAET